MNTHTINFSLKEDAEKVLKALREIVDTFGAATVQDLHDLCGMPSTYSDQKKGWTSVNSARISITDDDTVLLTLSQAENLFEESQS